MVDYNELYELLNTKSFIEFRSDDKTALIQVYDAISLIMENYQLVKRDETSYEYGYMRASGLNQSIVLIGDENAFNEYKIDVANSRTVPTRRYFRRPTDKRNWEEFEGLDAALLN